MYYLQSRYYDPMVGRFINADNTDYINCDNTICSVNIFTYCGNDGINRFDPTGHGAFKAIGIQIAMTWKRLVIGLEILWDTSRWKPYFFFFVGGGSKNFMEEAERALKEDLMYCLKRVPKISTTSLQKFSNFGLSVSFIAVFGNRFSSFPSTYTGWFTGCSLSIRHVIISGAVGYSGKAVIGSFGLGITTSVLNFSASQTHYWQIKKDTSLSEIFAPLKTSISNKMAWLSCFTFLLI